LYCRGQRFPLPRQGSRIEGPVQSIGFDSIDGGAQLPVAHDQA